MNKKRGNIKKRESTKKASPIKIKILRWYVVFILFLVGLLCLLWLISMPAMLSAIFLEFNFYALIFFIPYLLFYIIWKFMYKRLKKEDIDSYWINGALISIIITVILIFTPINPIKIMGSYYCAGGLACDNGYNLLEAFLISILLPLIINLFIGIFIGMIFGRISHYRVNIK